MWSHSVQGCALPPGEQWKAGKIGLAQFLGKVSSKCGVTLHIVCTLRATSHMRSLFTLIPSMRSPRGDPCAFLPSPRSHLVAWWLLRRTPSWLSLLDLDLVVHVDLLVHVDLACDSWAVCS
jgi:hypothetical protein